MVLTKIERYCDEWPQVAEISSIDNDNVHVTVIWYKGARCTTWSRCSIPVPGQRGKRMPWKEIINKEDIWLSGWKLTNANLLPKHVKDKIDSYN